MALWLLLGFAGRAPAADRAARRRSCRRRIPSGGTRSPGWSPGARRAAAASRRPPSLWDGSSLAQFGFLAPSVPREIGLGLALPARRLGWRCSRR